MTHIKRQKYFHQLRGRGYNKNCVLYPRTWVNEINYCRFICVM